MPIALLSGNVKYNIDFNKFNLIFKFYLLIQELASTLIATLDDKYEYEYLSCGFSHEVDLPICPSEFVIFIQENILINPHFSSRGSFIQDLPPSEVVFSASVTRQNDSNKRSRSVEKKKVVGCLKTGSENKEMKKDKVIICFYLNTP